MELTVSKRNNDKKSTVKVIRRNGNIPAIIYSRGKKGESVEISGVDFSTAVRNMKKGHLAVEVFTLTGEASGRKALVKGIEYHPTTYQVFHIDLMELHDDTTVTVNVPLEFTGAVECAGIKLGGFLRPVIRRLRVNCLPKNIPTCFLIDVRELGVKGTKRLKDIQLPEGVTSKANLDEVAVVIAKR